MLLASETQNAARRLVPDLSWPSGSEYLDSLLMVLSAGRRELLAVTFHDIAGTFLGEAQFAGGEAFLKVRYRELIEQALASRADKILLMHNHPSGNPRPSEADLVATAALTSLCRPLEIQLVDHLIVGGRQVVSMRAGGFFNRRTRS